MIDKTLAQRDRQVTQKYYEILDYKQWVILKTNG